MLDEKNNKLKELEEKYEKEKENIINNYKRLDSICNFIKINEIVYDTFNKYKNNLYHNININNILISYCKIDDFKNTIIKRYFRK